MNLKANAALAVHRTALRRRSKALLAWARAGQIGAGYVDPRHPQPGVRV